jgi:hypothetical protein
MVLGAPVRATGRGSLRFSLPAGHVLTSDNLHQFLVHHALAAHRVMQIFSGADLTDPTMAALFDQVLGYRSA